MHRLDGHINDLEPRIKGIYDNTPNQSEPSLQVSLSSYGWILLDSWIAWRTLRFLLRDTFIDNGVHEKWFRTPSSYSASQLKAVWRLDDSAESFIANKTGKGLKELFDNTIQKKRNASAHFSNSTMIYGSDSQEIKLYFTILSKVFLFYETKSFFASVSDKLTQSGFESFKIYFNGSTNGYDLSSVSEKITEYDNSNCFSIIASNNNGKVINIYVEEDGCFVGCDPKSNKTAMKSIINSTHSRYYFWGNKGFYQDVDLFVSTLFDCLDGYGNK